MLSARAASADGGASRLHLRYEAPSGCPSRKDLLDALDARIQRSWVDGADTRSFDVRVARARGGGFTGRLEIRQADRSPNAREIHGETCKAVTTSLAVFIAIAIDPESDAAQPEHHPAKELGEADRQPSADEEIAAPVPPRRPERRAPAPAPDTARTTWTWRTGYALSHVRSPRPGWGHRLHAELAWGDERARLTPAVRLSWGWADFSTFPPLAGEARFRRKAVRLEGCARFELPPLAAAGCAGLDAGTLTATAPDLPRFFQVSTRWTAATGTLRAGWAIARWLELEAAVGVLLPFERPRFTVQEPRRLVHRSPSVLFEGTAGLGVILRFQ